jgi:hypothetical protein
VLPHRSAHSIKSLTRDVPDLAVGRVDSAVQYQVLLQGFPSVQTFCELLNYFDTQNY